MNNLTAELLIDQSSAIIFVKESLIGEIKVALLVEASVLFAEQILE
jgi:hypothetical protein